MVSQFYAGSKAQVTSVIINARLLPTEQLGLLARSRATLWRGDDASIIALRPLALEGVTLAAWKEAKATTREPKPPFGQPSIPAWLLYTSGPTGKAKAVLLSDANLIAAAARANTLCPNKTLARVCRKDGHLRQHLDTPSAAAQIPQLELALKTHDNVLDCLC